MDFYEWRDFGVDAGWISKPICTTHDGFDLTDDEEEIDEEYGEVCIFASRYYERKIAGFE